VAQCRAYTPATEALRGRRCVGQWVWELPVFPAALARAFDRIDEVWVPSAYVAASVAAATTKPVRIVPHVVNPQAANQAEVRARLGVREDEIVFACVFDQRSYVARKNPQAAVRAFIDAFPNRRAAVRLLIKCNGDSGGSLRELAALVRDRPGISVIRSTLSCDETWQLHAACDVHVSLHRAKGFGLNIAEAMAFGKLAIVTNFSGNADFTTVENALLMDFDMRRVALHEFPHGEGQWWADPKHDAAVAAMRTAYQDAALRRRLGARARHDIERFSPGVVGHRMAGLLGHRQR
jgi:glycosyltransferase involved in cell wall biosynthesis